MATLYNVMRIRWNNFRFKRVNFIAQLLALFLITLYQCLIIFGYETDAHDKFFPYSALFLHFNMLCLTFLIFFSKYDEEKDVLNLMRKFFPRSGEHLDRRRENDIVEEIQMQKEDPNWRPSFEDLVDIITI